MFPTLIRRKSICFPSIIKALNVSKTDLFLIRIFIFKRVSGIRHRDLRSLF